MVIDRVVRIVRSNLHHLRRSVSGAFGRAAEDERYGGPEGEPADRSSAIPEGVRRAFAALEIPLDTAEEGIRRAWRRLMARYHPDRHANDPARESVANELSRRLTEAYRVAMEWRRKVSGGPPAGSPSG